MLLQERSVDRECGNLVLRIVREIEIGQLGDFTRSKNDDWLLLHDISHRNFLARLSAHLNYKAPDRQLAPSYSEEIRNVQPDWYRERKSKGRRR
ncbi:hypothetical protein [Bradyrhizobium japonicum]|uniref:hypothetical protein n=1 Tax=Bradyrhizobium japonicum TaxID=375 RepID=UPI0020130E86|nr:hypothetical protein [Bradyrhizobium japonicum]